MLRRLKYVSRFARPMPQGELDALAAHSAEANAEVGITGLLLSSGGLFFQVLEGPLEETDQLFVKICQDERHADVLLMSSEVVEERLFPGWSMRGVDLDHESFDRAEPLRLLLKSIVLQRELLQELVGGFERAVWTELTR